MDLVSRLFWRIVVCWMVLWIPWCCLVFDFLNNTIYLSCVWKFSTLYIDLDRDVDVWCRIWGPDQERIWFRWVISRWMDIDGEIVGFCCWPWGRWKLLFEVSAQNFHVRSFYGQCWTRTLVWLWFLCYRYHCIVSKYAPLIRTCWLVFECGSLSLSFVLLKFAVWTISFSFFLVLFLLTFVASLFCLFFASNVEVVLIFFRVWILYFGCIFFDCMDSCFSGCLLASARIGLTLDI